MHVEHSLSQSKKADSSGLFNVHCTVLSTEMLLLLQPPACTPACTAVLVMVIKRDDRNRKETFLFSLLFI